MAANIMTDNIKICYWANKQ